jgi:hypothetical protein
MQTIKNGTTTMVNTEYQKLNNNSGEYRISKTEQQEQQQLLLLLLLQR